MTQKIINIGSGPNTQTGDPVRLAFDKVNQNFTELYQLTGGSGADLDELIQDNAAILFTHEDNVGISFVYDNDNNKIVATVASQFPNQTGNDGKYLYTDGTNLSWETINYNPTQLNNNDFTLTLENNGNVSMPQDRALNFNQNMLGMPNNTGSTDRIRLWDFYGDNPSGFNYAIGVEGNHVWFLTDVTSDSGGFKFYSQDTQVLKIGGNGTVFLNGGGQIGNNYDDGSNNVGLQPGESGYALINSNNLQQYVQVDDTNVYIGTGWPEDNHTWTFNKSAGLVFPNDTTQYTAFDPSNIVFDGNITVTAGEASFIFGTDGGLYVPQDLTVDGNSIFSGNITFNGDVTLPGTINQITGNSGEYFGNPTTGVGALYAGKTSFTPVPDTVFQTSGYVNGYIQNNFQNTNPGNQASADNVITADNGTDTSGYIDLGIANSGWDGTQGNSLGTALSPNDGYLYVQNGTGTVGGDLVLGTTTSGKKIKIVAGGTGSEAIVADFSENGFNLSTGGITFPDSSVQTTAMLRGYTGSIGAGYTGSAGSSGASGYAGSRGYTGSSGTNGYTGSAGINGYTGSAGTNGYTGSAGDNGYSGSIGFTGSIGTRGYAGSMGYTGSAGTNGYTGSAGSNGYTGSVGYVGSQGIAGNNLSNVTIILDNISALATNGADVTQWSAAYTGQGGQLLIRADITAYTTATANRNWYLKKNGVTVETGQFYFNVTSTHLTMPTLQYIDTSGSTSAATWSITVGSGLYVDAQDRASISVTEYAGFSGLTVSGLINSSYLLAQNSVDQNSVTQNTAVIFQTTLNSNGTLINKNSNTQITLTAGQTYKLEAIIRRFTSSSSWGTFRWYDVTNSAYIGVEAFGEMTTSGLAVASTGIATTYVSPNANTTYELRQTTVNTITVSALYATIEVTQINPTVSLGTISAITASGDLSGRYLISTNATGDEGGEIQLAKPPNATISGGVTVDAYQNKIRIFEQGGTARGVYIDLTKTAAGVGSELLTKVSGYVNAGSYVTLDNIKATVTTSGQRGLSLATVSGSITYTIGANFGYVNGAGGGSSNGSATLTTTPTGSFFGWSFPDAGAMAIYILSDLTNTKTYRITLQIGGGYSNNFICIERLS